MSAWRLAVLLLVGLPLLAVALVFLAALVVTVRERLRGGPPDVPVVPWRSRANVAAMHPTRAVVVAWAQRPSAEERAACNMAHDAVRAAMPQLAEALERMVADARQYAAAGVSTSVGPCAYGAHEWRPSAGVPGVVECARCPEVAGVAGPSQDG